MPGKNNLFVGLTIKAKDLAGKVIDQQRGRLKTLGKDGLAFVARWAKRVALIFVGTFTTAMVAATRAAAKFQMTMAEVSTLLKGDSSQAVANLSNQVLELTRTMPKDANDLGSALYQVLSAGISDTAEAMHVMEVSAKAATAGLTDTRTAVDAITTVINAFGVSADEAMQIADIMFATVQEGKITFEQMASEIGVVANSAALAGISFEEVGAAIATMTKSGIQSSEATTALNRLLLSIISPQAEAAAAAKAMGVEWNVAGLESRGFAGLLADLEEATRGNVEALQSVVPDIRSFKAAAVIAGTGAAEYARQVGIMNDSTGATEGAFEKIKDTFSSTWQLLKNRLNEQLIRMGSAILPTLGDAVKDMTGEMTNFGTWIEQNEELLGRLAEGIGAVGLKLVQVAQFAVVAGAAISDFFLTLAKGVDQNLFEANFNSLTTALDAMGDDASKIARFLNDKAERRLEVERQIAEIEEGRRRMGDARGRGENAADNLEALKAEQRALEAIHEVGMRNLTTLGQATVDAINEAEEERESIRLRPGEARVELDRVTLKIDEKKWQQWIDEALLTMDLHARGVTLDLVDMRAEFQRIQDLEAFAAMSADADELKTRTEALTNAQKAFQARIASVATAMEGSGLSMDEMRPILFELAQMANAMGVEWDESGKTMAEVLQESLEGMTDLKRVMSDIVVGFVRDFGSAIEGAFSAMIDGSKSAGKALAAGLLGAIASVARGFGEMFMGLATAALASTFFPGNPGGVAAAAKYAAAATAMFALAGVLGGASSAVGGSGTGGGGAFGTGNLDGAAAEQGELTIILKTTDSNNPEFLRSLVEGLEQVSGRKVITRPRR